MSWDARAARARSTSNLSSSHGDRHRIAHARDVRPRRKPPSHQCPVVARPHQMSPQSEVIRDPRMRCRSLGVSHRVEHLHHALPFSVQLAPLMKNPSADCIIPSRTSQNGRFWRRPAVGEWRIAIRSRLLGFRKADVCALRCTAKTTPSIPSIRSSKAAVRFLQTRRPMASRGLVRNRYTIGRTTMKGGHERANTSATPCCRVCPLCQRPNFFSEPTVGPEAGSLHRSAICMLVAEPPWWWHSELAAAQDQGRSGWYPQNCMGRP